MSVRKTASLVRQLPYIVEPSPEELENPSPPQDMLLTEATASMSFKIESKSNSESSSIR